MTVKISYFFELDYLFIEPRRTNRSCDQAIEKVVPIFL